MPSDCIKPAAERRRSDRDSALIRPLRMISHHNLGEGLARMVCTAGDFKDTPDGRGGLQGVHASAGHKTPGNRVTLLLIGARPADPLDQDSLPALITRRDGSRSSRVHSFPELVLQRVSTPESAEEIEWVTPAPSTQRTDQNQAIRPIRRHASTCRLTPHASTRMGPLRSRDGLAPVAITKASTSRRASSSARSSNRSSLTWSSSARLDGNKDVDRSNRRG